MLQIHHKNSSSVVYCIRIRENNFKKTQPIVAFKITKLKPHKTKPIDPHPLFSVTSRSTFIGNIPSLRTSVNQANTR